MKQESNLIDDQYIHYLYKITNKINGRYYIGIHSLLKTSNKTPETDGYWGSGRDIKESIKLFGKENFCKTILKTFSSREEAKIEERKLVNYSMLSDPKSYNKILGGGEVILGKVLVNIIGTDKNILVSREEFDKNRDKFESARKNTQNGMKNRIWITNGKVDKAILNTDPIPDGWRKGKITNKLDGLISKKLYRDKITKEEVYLSKEEASLLDSNSTLFPDIFFQRNDNKDFLSYDYLQKLYNATPSWAAISKLVGLCIDSIRKVRDYYIKAGYKFYSTNKLKRAKRGTISPGFSNKSYVTNLITGDSFVVDNKDLPNYTENPNEWYIGKKIRKELINLKSEIYNKYINSETTIRKLSKEYKTDQNVIKILIGLSNSDAKVYWFKNKDGKFKHGLYNSKMVNDLINLGWEIKSLT